MSRIRTLVIAFAATAALAGGGVAFATNSHAGKEPIPPRTPQVNAANVPVQTGYVPITPCRIADTRKGGGAIGTNRVRGFHISGTTGFLPQGARSASGCGIPIGATTAVLGVTTTTVTRSGYLSLFADGTPRPGAAQVFSVKGLTTLTTANAPLNATTGVVDVYSAFKTDVVLDVVGYYREPIAVAVNYDGSLASYSNQVVGVTHSATGLYQVNFSQTVMGCVAVATADASAYNISVYTGGTSATLFVRDVVTAGQPYVNAGFTLTVTC